jgi:hypothetical protein
VCSSHCTILVLARCVLHAGRCTFLSDIAILLRPALSFYYAPVPFVTFRRGGRCLCFAVTIHVFPGLP